MTASTPPLVDVITEALAGHQWYDATTDSEDPATGCTGCDDWFGDENAVDDGTFAAHQARAVLEALTKAGDVEWGTGEGDALMTWRDQAQAERQSASATKSYDRGATWVNTNPPVVSRITGPWERAE